MDLLNRDNVNRALIVALLLIWVICWAGAIVVVLVFPTESIATANDVVNFLERNNTIYTRLMFTVLGIVFILAALLLIVAELAPRGIPAVRLSQVAGGTALLTTQAIVQRLKYEVEHLDQVGEAKPVVKSRGKVVNIRLDLRTAPQADIVKKTEEVCGVVRQVVEEMGVKLGRPPTVYIHPEPLLVPLATRKAEALTAKPASFAQEREDKTVEGVSQAEVITTPQTTTKTEVEDKGND